MYNIPVYSNPPARNILNDDLGRGPVGGFSFDIGRLAIDPQLNMIPRAADESEAIPFPSYDDMDVVHGQGTIALELEREMNDRAQTATARRVGYKSKPDIVVSDIDSGITLSGICMAFAGTGTRVFGAAPTAGFWDHAWKQHVPGFAPSMPNDNGNRYWADTKHPMSTIPWRTFTSPYQLSGVFEVNHEQVYAASILARDHYRLQLEPDEAVPLAVALYNDEFIQLVSRESKGGRKQAVGIILRSRKTPL